MENGAEMRISAPFGVSGGRELLEYLLPRTHCDDGAIPVSVRALSGLF
jgi:hypothetical protein